MDRDIYTDDIVAERAYTHLATYYDRLMQQDCDYDKWSQYVFRLLKRHCRKTLRGADAACGTGSITRRLLQLGCDVFGFDSSAEMLCAAVENNGDNNKPLYIQADLTRFDAGEQLNFVTCCCDGINYIAPSRLFAAFKNIWQNLASGGVLLFDISSKYKYRHLLDGRTYTTEAEGVYCAFSGLLNRAGDRLDMDVELFTLQHNGLYMRQRESHRQYVHNTAKVQQLLEDAGFCKVFIYGFPTTKPPAPDSERIQFVAIKQ